ncbi:hypothetical protein [Methylobacterium sp. 190mf]|uniref:hypothetical protein n=1 Tax=Methylobacterium sp. 190mf TaxID=1761798 RepID=UPI0011B015B5|nr:hypothetical protein [Methylobacterium sp. 190mf]
MTSDVNTAEFVKISGSKVEIDFKDLSVSNREDLSNVIKALASVISDEFFKARQANNREWSASATVTTTSGGTTASATGTYTSRDWSASVSGSTPIGGGISGTATVTTGSSGTSGTIGISGTF